MTFRLNADLLDDVISIIKKNERNQTDYRFMIIYDYKLIIY